MAGVIKNRELKKSLNNIGQDDWVRVAEQAGFTVLRGNSGSHYINIRDPKYPDPRDIRGLVSTITTNSYKQANEHIFKRFLKFGVLENDIWKGLSLM